MSIKILIVEDDIDISDMLVHALTWADYECIVAADTDQAQLRLYNALPDIVLLDWMLPGMSGIEFVRLMKKREEMSQVPIIMLTAKGEEEDKVLALSQGVDDYVTKPFSPRELIERIKAVLRRTSPHVVETVITVAGLSMDTAAYRVVINGNTISLGPKEYQLLHFFITHLERVYSRTQLLDHVWGINAYVEERTVDVHVRRLRKALSDYGYDRFIQTVRGAGYRFSPKAP